MKIQLTVNGRAYAHDVEDHFTLLRFLREGLGLTGTKEGCGAGECGACTVLMGGKPVNACLILAVEADGRTIETIEGEAREGRLTPLQDALKRHQAVQCGFCTPGIVLTLRSFLDENPKPTAHDVAEAIEGNFCRCTGYQQIIEAVLDVAGQTEPGRKEPRHV